MEQVGAKNYNKLPIQGSDIMTLRIKVDGYID